MKIPPVSSYAVIKNNKMALYFLAQKDSYDIYCVCVQGGEQVAKHSVFPLFIIKKLSVHIYMCVCVIHTHT